MLKEYVQTFQGILKAASPKSYIFNDGRVQGGAVCPAFGNGTGISAISLYISSYIRVSIDLF